MPAPSIISPPVISGSLVRGSTLTCSEGTWDNDPTTFRYQWERCDPDGSNCVDIQNAVGSSYTLQSADVGHAIGCGVTASNDPADVPPENSPGGLRRITVPSYSGGATIVTSQAAAIAALNSMSGGELVIRGNIAMPASDSFIFQRDYGGLKVWHENGAHYPGLAANNAAFYGLWLKGARNLSMYGLDVANPAGMGLVVSNGSHDLQLVGSVANVGASCFFTNTYSSGGDVYNIDVDLDLSDCGNKLSLDPHAENGTGLHPFYIGSTPDQNSSFFTRNCTFTLIAHDCDTGQGNLGSNIHSCEFWIDARRLNKVALSQVAGNAAGFWGGNLRDVHVRYIYGEDLQGRVVDMNGVYSGGSDGQVTVDFARGLRCCKNTRMNEPISESEYFDSRHGVTYLDKAVL